MSKRGRKKGWRAERRKIKGTVFLYRENWQDLDDIGPSRGRAIEKLISLRKVIENENKK